MAQRIGVPAVRALAVGGPVSLRLALAAHQARTGHEGRRSAALPLAMLWLIGSVVVLRPRSGG